MRMECRVSGGDLETTVEQLVGFLYGRILKLIIAQCAQSSLTHLSERFLLAMKTGAQLELAVRAHKAFVLGGHISQNALIRFR